MITAMCLKNKWNVFLQNYCYPPNNSVLSGSNKNNMAVSPAGRETLVEKMRFQCSTDEEKQNLLNEKDSLSTKRATKGALMCLQQYLLATNREIDLESYCSSEPQLSAMLVNFYADARKKNGEHYKLSRAYDLDWLSILALNME